MTTQNNSLDFKNQQFYIGLDVHKKRWVVTIRSNKMELKTFSMDPVAEQLNKYMEKNYPGGKYYSVYEAGFCGYGLHRELESYGFKNIIAAPTEIPTSNKEKNKKRDPVDSRKLSRERENDSLEGIYILNQLQQELRSIVRQRLQLMKKQTRLKNQIKGYLHFYGHKLPENCEVRHWTKNFIEEITLLCSVPGVGFVVAITLLTELIDPKRFPDLDNLASYVGLVPCILSSSEKETKLGIKFHSKTLLSASWGCWRRIAIRKPPTWTYSYNNYI